MSYLQTIPSTKKIINLLVLCVFLLLSTFAYGQNNPDITEMDFDLVFHDLFKKAVKSSDARIQMKITNFPEAVYEFTSSRDGANLEDVILTLDVFIISDFELGAYDNQITNLTFPILADILTDYLNEKEEKYLRQIRIKGSCTGIADAHKVGPRLKYKGEYGEVTNIEYSDISSGVGRRGFGKVKIANISEGQEISNLDLAFLRAYNVTEYLDSKSHEFPDLVEFDVNNIELKAFDEKDSTGYQYRKVTLNLLVENFYLDQ